MKFLSTLLIIIGLCFSPAFARGVVNLTTTVPGNVNPYTGKKGTKNP